MSVESGGSYEGGTDGADGPDGGFDQPEQPDAGNQLGAEPREADQAPTATHSANGSEYGPWGEPTAPDADPPAPETARPSEDKQDPREAAETVQVKLSQPAGQTAIVGASAPASQESDDSGNGDGESPSEGEASGDKNGDSDGGASDDPPAADPNETPAEAPAAQPEPAEQPAKSEEPNRESPDPFPSAVGGVIFTAGTNLNALGHSGGEGSDTGNEETASDVGNSLTVDGVQDVAAGDEQGDTSHGASVDDRSEAADSEDTAADPVDDGTPEAADAAPAGGPVEGEATEDPSDTVDDLEETEQAEPVVNDGNGEADETADSADDNDKSDDLTDAAKEAEATEAELAAQAEASDKGNGDGDDFVDDTAPDPTPDDVRDSEPDEAKSTGATVDGRDTDDSTDTDETADSADDNDKSDDLTDAADEAAATDADPDPDNDDGHDPDDDTAAGPTFAEARDAEPDTEVDPADQTLLEHDDADLYETLDEALNEFFTSIDRAEALLSEVDDIVAKDEDTALTDPMGDRDGNGEPTGDKPDLSDSKEEGLQMVITPAPGVRDLALAIAAEQNALANMPTDADTPAADQPADGASLADAANTGSAADPNNGDPSANPDAGDRPSDSPDPEGAYDYSHSDGPGEEDAVVVAEDRNPADPAPHARVDVEGSPIGPGPGEAPDQQSGTPTGEKATDTDGRTQGAGPDNSRQSETPHTNPTVGRNPDGTIPTHDIGESGGRILHVTHETKFANSGQIPENGKTRAAKEEGDVNKGIPKRNEAVRSSPNDVTPEEAEKLRAAGFWEDRNAKPVDRDRYKNLDKPDNKPLLAILAPFEKLFRSVETQVDLANIKHEPGSSEWTIAVTHLWATRSYTVKGVANQSQAIKEAKSMAWKPWVKGE